MGVDKRGGTIKPATYRSDRTAVEHYLIPRTAE
jgi:hypothetical protein